MATSYLFTKHAGVPAILNARITVGGVLFDAKAALEAGRGGGVAGESFRVTDECLAGELLTLRYLSGPLWDAEGFDAGTGGDEGFGVSFRGFESNQLFYDIPKDSAITSGGPLFDDAIERGDGEATHGVLFFFDQEEAGDVSLTMTEPVAGTLDCLMFLFSDASTAVEAEITYDDDTGPDHLSQLDPHIDSAMFALEPGRYFVLVVGYAETDAGEFTILLTEPAPAPLLTDSRTFGTREEVIPLEVGTSLVYHVGYIDDFNLLEAPWTFTDIIPGFTSNSRLRVVAHPDGDMAAVNAIGPDGSGLYVWTPTGLTRIWSWFDPVTAISPDKTMVLTTHDLGGSGTLLYCRSTIDGTLLATIDETGVSAGAGVFLDDDTVVYARSPGGTPALRKCQVDGTILATVNTADGANVSPRQVLSDGRILCDMGFGDVHRIYESDLTTFVEVSRSVLSGSWVAIHDDVLVGIGHAGTGVEGPAIAALDDADDVFFYDFTAADGFEASTVTAAPA